MKIPTQEQEEALQAIVAHYGFPVLMALLDDTVDLIQRGILSVPLDKNPESAALSLYAERMKAEGAMAVRNAMVNKTEAIRTRKREG